MTQGAISIADAFGGHHVLRNKRLSPGTELFKLEKVGQDEYKGSFLERDFAERWYVWKKFTVLGDYATEVGNSPNEVIIWKRDR